MSHWVVIFIAAISGLMLLWPLVAENVSGLKKIDPQSAVQLLNRRNAVLIDVRDATEVLAGAIAQAKHFPLAELEGRVGELAKQKEKPVIVYCQSGSRSNVACAVLKKNGFTEVYSLDGGLLAWEKAGLPVSG